MKKSRDINIITSFDFLLSEETAEFNTLAHVVHDEPRSEIYFREVIYCLFNTKIPLSCFVIMVVYFENNKNRNPHKALSSKCMDEWFVLICTDHCDNFDFVSPCSRLL